MIELIDIRKTYNPGDEIVNALDGVSLRIEQGEFVAIMGASGSGKSTLMQILGLLDTPTSGQYKLFGSSVESFSPNKLAGLRSRFFGFVFQQFFLLPRLDALGNAALPMLYTGQAISPTRPQECLEKVGLSARLHHRPNQMSGGQQQRVAIARALVNDPEIIFADEPTGNLDSHTKVEIMQQLIELNKAGKTVILVTHEPEMAQYAKRIVTMRDGKVLSDERVDSLDAITQKKKVIVPDVSEHGALDFSRIKSYIAQAWSAIAGHKTRSLLSVLGILIGVAAVIAMVSLGEGATKQMEKSFSSLGANMLIIHPGAPKSGAVMMQSGAASRLSEADVKAIRTQIYDLRGVSGSTTDRVQALAMGKNTNTQLEGVEPEYEIIRNITPIAGRFFTQEEATAGAKVAVVGSEVVKALWGENANPVGLSMRINNTYFTVIGVLPVRGSSGPRNQDDTIVVPLKTAMKRVSSKDYIDYIYLDINSPKNVEKAQTDVVTILDKNHRTTPGQESAFEVRNMADIKNSLSSMTQTMTALLGTVAAISLVVGGIGIMNIMLVAVVERTREIGLRKAIGATRHDILYQFLFESIFLSFLGGLLGIILGAGVSLIITAVLKWTAFVSMFAVILSTAFSIAIGVLFGLWPAVKASSLSPIVALRSE